MDGGGGSHGSAERRLGADAKALLSTLESDAYPAELTGAVSVNFLFIERAPSQLGGKVTGYLMHQSRAQANRAEKSRAGDSEEKWPRGAG